MTSVVGHAHAGHKHGQAEHFDHLGSSEFEIHRPHRESRLYQFVLGYKFSRAVGLLPWSLKGRRVLTVCAGSGMDAEYLEQAGARVVALDISVGALLRARERARTYDLGFQLVQGDAEHLPFRSDSFDVSFVHDGLHHLPEPRLAIAEMGRIATGAVIITEPADAFLTKLAIAVRLIPAREDSGNVVIRFEAPTLIALLRELGFPTGLSARYLVKYGHPSPGWWRVFDNWLAFGLARAAILLIGERLLGGLGNKLSVAGIRNAPVGAAHDPAEETASQHARRAPGRRPTPLASPATERHSHA